MTTLPPEVIANIASKRLGITQQRDRNLQQLGNQYNQNLGNLADYSTDATKRINDQYASQGTFDSGVRVDEQGRLQKNIGQKRGMLSTQYSQGQTGFQNDYESAIQALNDYQTEQMTGQTRSDLDTQLRQQAINAQNAATMQASQQQQAAAAGPSQADIDAWNAALMQNQANQELWFRTIAAQNLEKTYRGGVGMVR